MTKQIIMQEVKIDQAGVVTVRLPGSIFKISPDNRVIAYTECSVNLQAAFRVASKGVVKLGKDGTVAAYNTKIMPTATGFTVHAKSVTLRAAKTATAIGAALDALKIGQVMKDGTIYFGALKGVRMFTTTDNAQGLYAFDNQNAASEWLNQNHAYSHNDWKNPTQEELGVLCANWMEAKLSPVFQDCTLWSASPVSKSHPAGKHGPAGWAQRAGYTDQIPLYNPIVLEVRCIRHEFS
jgi:hypothetical protein